MAPDTRTPQETCQLPEVALVNGMPMVSSLQVATHFNKQHKNVVRHIQGILRNAPEFSRLNFELAEYTDAQGKPRPVYDMTRDAFALVAMGFTGPEAMTWKIRYIEAFNAMETKLQGYLPHSEEEEKVSIEQIRPFRPCFRYAKPSLMSKKKMDGIKGWLDYWCYTDNLELNDAKKQLCTVLQVNDLSEVQEDNTICAFNFIWWSLFKIKTKLGDELTKEQLSAFNGLLTFWEKCLGESYNNIKSFICTKCNLRSFDEIKQHSLQKAFNAALLGIFRHILCNSIDNISNI